jgi:hypothetical protein
LAIKYKVPEEFLAGLKNGIKVGLGPGLSVNVRNGVMEYGVAVFGLGMEFTGVGVSIGYACSEIDVLLGDVSTGKEVAVVAAFLC